MLEALLILSLLLNVWLIAAYVREKRRRPPQPPTRMHLTVTSLDDAPYLKGTYWDLPTDRARLIKLAVELGYDPIFSGSRFYGPGKLFVRSQYEALRDELIRRGLAEWVNNRAHNQSVVLTVVGRHVMKRIASYAPPPHSEVVSANVPEFSRQVQAHASTHERGI